MIDILSLTLKLPQGEPDNYVPHKILVLLGDTNAMLGSTRPCR